MMIFIVQYLLWQSGQQKKDSKQASIVMQGSIGWLNLISLKAKWMIIQAVEKYMYYKKVLQPVITRTSF